MRTRCLRKEPQIETWLVRPNCVLTKWLFHFEQFASKVASDRQPLKRNPFDHCVDCHHGYEHHMNKQRDSIDSTLLWPNFASFLSIRTIRGKWESAIDSTALSAGRRCTTIRPKLHSSSISFEIELLNYYINHKTTSITIKHKLVQIRYLWCFGEQAATGNREQLAIDCSDHFHESISIELIAEQKGKQLHVVVNCLTVRTLFTCSTSFVDLELRVREKWNEIERKFSLLISIEVN